MLVNCEPPIFQNQVLPYPPSQLERLSARGLFITSSHCDPFLLLLCMCIFLMCTFLTSYKGHTITACSLSFPSLLRGGLLHIPPPPQ